VPRRRISHRFRRAPRTPSGRRFGFVIKLDGYDKQLAGCLRRYVPDRSLLQCSTGDQIALKNFRVEGESPGWNGSLASSPLTHRRETIIARRHNASRLWVVISSAGPRPRWGLCCCQFDRLKNLDRLTSVVLMQFPSDQELEQAGNSPPAGWERDGTHVEYGKDCYVDKPPRKRLGHSGRRRRSHGGNAPSSMPSAPAVQPGDNLLIEWNEAFTTGTGDTSAANYQKLTRATIISTSPAVDIFGNQTGANISFGIVVPPPFWRSVVVWDAIRGFPSPVSSWESWRYLAWPPNAARALAGFEESGLWNRNACESRATVHDDLGARVTEISLGQRPRKDESVLFPESAGADFDPHSQ